MSIALDLNHEPVSAIESILDSFAARGIKMREIRMGEVEDSKIIRLKIPCSHPRVIGPFFEGCLECEPELKRECLKCTAPVWRCCC